MNKKIMLGMLSTLMIPITVAAAVSCGQTQTPGQSGNTTSEKDKTKKTETPGTTTPGSEADKNKKTEKPGGAGTATPGAGKEKETKPETPGAGTATPGTNPGTAGTNPGTGTSGTGTGTGTQPKEDKPGAGAGTGTGGTGAGTPADKPTNPKDGTPATNPGDGGTGSGTAAGTPTMLKPIGTQSSSIAFENVDWDPIKDIPANTKFELVYVPGTSKYTITYMGKVISDNSPHGAVLPNITNSNGEMNKFDAFITVENGTKFLVANFKTPLNKEEFVKVMDLS